MDGEVLEVEPETNYQLIETITLEEDVSAITRTAAPDGTAYQLDGIIVVCTSPGVSESKAASITITLDGAGTMYTYAQNMIYATKNGYNVYCAEVRNGTVEITQALAGTNYEPHNPRWARKVTGSTHIKKISMSITGGIPAGTKFDIYGR